MLNSTVLNVVEWKLLLKRNVGNVEIAWALNLLDAFGGPVERRCC